MVLGPDIELPEHCGGELAGVAVAVGATGVLVGLLPPPGVLVGLGGTGVFIEPGGTGVFVAPPPPPDVGVGGIGVLVG